MVLQRLQFILQDLHRLQFILHDLQHLHAILPGASTPQSYSLGTSRNAECSNCKHLLDKITVLEAYNGWDMICIRKQYHSESEFPSLSVGASMVHIQNEGLKDGNTHTGGSTGQVHEVTDVSIGNNTPSNTPDATTAEVNDGNPNEVGLEFVMKEAPSSYVNKLSPTSLTKDNLRKLDANMPNDADFNIWLPLASVHEVNDTMKNSLCGYFIGKGHAFPVMECDDCPKATKRVVNKVDKGKDGSSGADDEGFIKVEKKKSGGVSLKTAPFVGKKHVWTSGNSSKTSGNSSKTSGNSSKMISKADISTSGNGTFSISSSFEALNVDDLVTEEVESADRGKCVFVDDDGKPLKKVDYSGVQGSKDEVEIVDNEMTSFLSSKSSGVGYDTKSLLEQWRETYGNNDYDPYDDDMYESYEIPDNIQSICDNLNIKRRNVASPSGAIVKDVLHVPKFKCNLLSVSRLSKELQCAVTFFPEFCIMQDLYSRTLIGAGDCEDGLYKMGMFENNRHAMMTTQTKVYEIAISNIPNKDSEAIDSKWVYKSSTSPGMEMLSASDSAHPLDRRCRERNWAYSPLDVNDAFLHGGLGNEDVYMKLPEGFGKQDDNRVCKLKKSLYGLKQASRNWYQKFTHSLLDVGFKQSHADHSLFIFKEKDAFVAALIYVDDVVLVGNDPHKIQATRLPG
ncbi:zinc finger, CCHC-type containing protein [Tanacetum coccineum]